MATIWQELFEMGIEDPSPGHLSGTLQMGFFLLIETLLSLRYSIGQIDIYPEDCSPNLCDGATFDFIIVGGGSSGCVIANRLTQISEWKVLLLEAGDYPSHSSEVPGLLLVARAEKDVYSYPLDMNPKYCQGMWNKRCSVFAARVLGGSSVVDAFHYFRGTHDVFRQWEEEVGSEWNPGIVDYYYDRNERYEGSETSHVKYGTKGDIYLHIFNTTLPLRDTIFRGAAELNLQRMQEGDNLGYVQCPAAIKDNARYNMAKAYLAPIKNRTNLYVAVNATVLRLLMRQPEKCQHSAVFAEGVEVWTGRSTKRFYANKEVILAAGTIETPKLLLLSGIGPKEHLRSHDIRLVTDLPVGYNLQLHYSVFIVVGVDRFRMPPSDPFDYVDATYSYLMHRDGPYAETGIHDLLGFINSYDYPFTFPNVEIYHLYFVRKDTKLPSILEAHGFHADIIASLSRFNKISPLIIFLPTIITPKSRGRVYLNGTNPMYRPLVDAGFFSDPHNEDFEVLYSAYLYLNRLTETAPFKDLVAQVLHVDIPNCRNFKPCTKAYMKCAIKNIGYPRPVTFAGTTKMGSWDDVTSVVNSKMMVRKVKNLRIAGASVMPYIVSNMLATNVMLGDRCSEFVKAKWIYKYVLPEDKTCTCKATWNATCPPVVDVTCEAIARV